MGLVGFMNCLKLEGERHNIQVNCVAPLAFTRINAEIIPENLQASLKPEYVASLVLYLCARECSATGGIYNAAMGYFNRTALVTSPTIRIGAPGEIPTLEEIHQQWNTIDALGDQIFNDAVSALFAMTPEQDE
jgi:NAD(P)-dependent dehydrogenase (short-subunit alcohol dehydrogenase family)